MEVMLRGFMVGNDREKVGIIKGDDGLKQFDSIVGKKSYNPTKYYPMSESLFCQKTAAQIIYGNTGAEAYKNLGSWDFKMVLHSQIGKISLSLFCPTMEKAIDNFVLIMNTFYSGMKCESKRINANQTDLIFYNNPYPKNNYIHNREHDFDLCYFRRDCFI